MRHALSGFVDLDRAATQPLHMQIARQIKAGILSGRIAARASLPSSRILSDELGVSRNTVLTAFDQLKAEGIIETVRGSGTRIADVRQPGFERSDPFDMPVSAGAHRLAPRWEDPLTRFQPFPLEKPRPFQPGIPDLGGFPRAVWGACLRRAALFADVETAGYAQMSGHPRLRNALVQYLGDTRGTAASPEQIIVTSSARGGLSLIVSALLSPGEEAAIEEPGFRGAKAIFSAAGGRLVPIPVDEQGIDVSRVPQGSRPCLIYTTPSHQYPTGALMALSRRLALIRYAEETGAYIIEDDYDSEFQYRGRPIAALQALDRSERVIYLGTFAKSLLPALRVGFVVAPTGLARELEKVHRHTGQFVPPIIQCALADFMERGHYRAHVRRMKALYEDRLERFAHGIAIHSRGGLEAAIPDGGLQTVVRSREALTDDALAARLEQAGIAAQPLSEFHIEPHKARRCGVLMGFAAWEEKQATKALQRLDILPQCRGDLGLIG